MKIVFSELENAFELDLSGQEEWLAPVLSTFKGDFAGNDGLTLKGRVAVTPLVTGEIQIDGKVNLTPKLECSRCLDMIPWQMDTEFSLVYKHQSAPTVKEKMLSRQDLDQYFAEEGMIDLAEVIEEQIFLNIPQQTIKKSPDGKTCIVCNDDISESLVYGKNDEKQNPFASLKDMLTGKNGPGSNH
jgi:uncharacterized metal-binding protein YceD (DUF177 family)